VDKSLVTKLHSSFEDMLQKDPETGAEFWLARDLQMLLGYARWENFAKVIEKAITACRTSGYEPLDHFRDITKMVYVGSGAKREVRDIALTRYACRSRTRKRAKKAYPF
jgi:DNA-damage-inducible protein D